MKVFITGTDTDIGKTLVSSWLCLHLGYDYFKPIQTGAKLGVDRNIVKKLSPGTFIHNEIYCYDDPSSPHHAAILEQQTIDMDKIILPNADNLIVEGAGGLMVPLNDQFLIIDLIKKLDIPVILVASTKLGTINHTLLSIEALNARKIRILGVILTGESDNSKIAAIELHGKVKVIGAIPYLENIDTKNLKSIAVSKTLKQLLET